MGEFDRRLGDGEWSYIGCIICIIAGVITLFVLAGGCGFAVLIFKKLFGG